MTDTVFCLWTLSASAIAFTMGWAACEQYRMKRQRDHAFEKAFVREAINHHVGPAQ